ncbi:MAG: prolyl oligopeptidase family serine peptidase [Bacteroidia bacterium]|nr:prolyl oligopeptidase family serine peptidase [Bacteroidia bacterium]NNJ55169.1 prolyl oligopeptidase family serine peptidase [Bacteroidia bacterium]
MSIVQNKSYKFKGSDNKLITADLTYAKYKEPVPICIFAHGFKGFKDWGAWPLAAEIFAVKQIPFFKFNFSHNGTTPEKLNDFSDLEAFGNNNFKKEYDDIGSVLDFIDLKAESFDFEWNSKIYIIGHSRGGAIALLRSCDDGRIDKCATWASVASLEKYTHLTDQKQWKEEGVHYILNGRTNQKMPMYYQFVESFEANKGLLDLDEKLGEITCPVLIAHGEDDNVVPLSDAHHIFNEISHSIMVEVEGANHTFNTKHPLTERKINKAFAEVLSETLEFFTL